MHNQRSIEIILFALIALTCAYFVQGGSWGVNARFDLTRALAENGSIDCRSYKHNSGDLVERNGRVIPYKAPGLSFLGAPVWSILYWGGGKTIAAGRHSLTFGAHLVTVATTGLFLAWAAVWFFRLSIAMGAGGSFSSVFITILAVCGTLLLPDMSLVQPCVGLHLSGPWE